MKYILLMTIGLILNVFGSFYVNAAEVYSRDQKIVRVNVYPSGDFTIHLSNIAAPICYGNGISLHVWTNHAGVTTQGVKALLSTALVANTTGQLVDIRYDNSVAHCWVSVITLKN